MNPTSPRISKTHWILIVLLVAIGIAAGAAILYKPPAGAAGGDEHGHAEGGEKPAASGDGHGDEHGHAEGDGDAHEAAAPKGPHGGRLFTENGFGLELLLVEDAGQPRFKAWLSEAGKPLPPSAAQVTVTLTRPDGQQTAYALKPAQDALVSAEPVPEPHAFEASIEVQTPKEPHRFAFSQDEGKVALSDAQIQAAGITVDRASAARIQSTLQLPGEIRFNEDRTAHVVPRLTGVVASVPVNLGQQVKKGQVLAVIDSVSVAEQRSELQTAQKRRALAQTTWEREKKLWDEKISPEQDVLSAQQALREAEIAVANAGQKLQALGIGAGGGGALNRYELRAPFDAAVVEKHITLGESVREDANVFTLSDLSTVWAEVSVAAKDLNRVRVGDRVVVRSTAFDESAEGTVAYVGALLGAQTRTASARIVVANPKGAWRPGLYVTVELVTGEAEAAVTVSTEAIQQVGDQAVVFLKVPGGFLPQPVQLGRSDGKRVEVVQGLAPGASYAAAGSFVVKSEAGKGSAEHAH